MRMTEIQIQRWAEKLNRRELERSQAHRSTREKTVWILMSIGVFMATLAANSC